MAWTVIHIAHSNDLEEMLHLYETLEGFYRGRYNTEENIDLTCAYTFVGNVLRALVRNTADTFNYTDKTAKKLAVDTLADCLHDGYPTRARIYREAIKNIRQL